MNSNGKVILGLLVGAAAGAALGLLFAPDKGDATRQRIADGAAGLGKRVMNRGEEAAESADEMYDAAQNMKSKAARSV